MGVPDRFATEYPRRALELIGVFEAPARENDLSAHLVCWPVERDPCVPFDRMRTSLLHNDVRDADLVKSKGAGQGRFSAGAILAGRAGRRRMATVPYREHCR